MHHFRDKTYELFCISLDEPQGFTDFEDQRFTIKSVLKYSNSDVGDNTIVQDLLVRSAMPEENLELFVFILHKG